MFSLILELPRYCELYLVDEKQTQRGFETGSRSHSWWVGFLTHLDAGARGGRPAQKLRRGRTGAGLGSIRESRSLGTACSLLPQPSGTLLGVSRNLVGSSLSQEDMVIPQLFPYYSDVRVS